MRHKRAAVVIAVGSAVVIAVVLAAGLVILFSRREIRHRTPIPRLLERMREIEVLFRNYRFSNEGRLPRTLAELAPEWASAKERAAYWRIFVYPGIPIVPGSDPPTSFRYVPPAADAPPETVVLYPNVRGKPWAQYVLRCDGKLEYLKGDEFERRIRALGEDYDGLPVIE